MSVGLVRPLVSAMVLRDEVQLQPDGSLHFLRVRHRVQCEGFPYLHLQLCVYLELTGHRSNNPCKLVAADGASDQDVFQSPTHVVRFDGPVTVTPIVLRLRHCPFPSRRFMLDPVLLAERAARRAPA